MKKAPLTLFVMAATFSFAQTKPVPPAPAATVPQIENVEPKKSVTSVSLELSEEKKKNLRVSQQMIIQQANQQLNVLKAQLDQEEKLSAQEVSQVKQENGWGEEVTYQAAQQMPDGSATPGKWIKTVKK